MRSKFMPQTIRTFLFFFALDKGHNSEELSGRMDAHEDFQYPISPHYPPPTPYLAGIIILLRKTNKCKITVQRGILWT